MKAWLTVNNCPVVAMESTGVYWHPVYNTIEDAMQVVLVNARHIKNVPGRKTDICDSKWLAGLLRHGLVKGSFIPPEHVREWRELSRLRRTYIQNLRLILSDVFINYLSRQILKLIRSFPICSGLPV